MQTHIRLRNQLVLVYEAMRARSLTQLRGDKYQSMQLCQGKNIFFVT